MKFALGLNELHSLTQLLHVTESTYNVVFMFCGSFRFLVIYWVKLMLLIQVWSLHRISKLLDAEFWLALLVHWNRSRSEPGALEFFYWGTRDVAGDDTSCKSFNRFDQSCHLMCIFCLFAQCYQNSVPQWLFTKVITRQHLIFHITSYPGLDTSTCLILRPLNVRRYKCKTLIQDSHVVSGLWAVLFKIFWPFTVCLHLRLVYKVASTPSTLLPRVFAKIFPKFVIFTDFSKFSLRINVKTKKMSSSFSEWRHHPKC